MILFLRNRMMEEKNPEFLIESLWVLENNSRICVFEQNYVDFTKDGMSTDMVSSFLAAILTFADETFTDEIQFIKFSNRRMLFRFSKYFLFVIAISDKDENRSNHIRQICNNIVNKFNEKYEHIFEKNQWNGSISIFDDFCEDLKEIVKKEPLKIKFFDFFDFKEQFKKVENYLKKKKIDLLKNKEKIEHLFTYFKKNNVT